MSCIRGARRARPVLWSLLAWLTLASTVNAQIATAQSPEAVFEANRANLFVVESYDRVSNNKNSVGSGFAISGLDGAELRIATNYHVVADAVLEPDAFGIRIVALGGEPILTEILAADPIHDLAVLRVADLADHAKTENSISGLVLATEKPTVGEDIFALGNPFDVGLSVVPGVYNGELKKHFRPLIHFTGALNPGMSGGPTLNSRGQVIGINVAGAGNSVGFLVPATELASLISVVNETPARGAVREQFSDRLLAHSQALIDDLVAGDWSLEEFGPLRIPKELRGYVNCRGAAKTEDEDRRWSRSVSDCRVEDRLFLSQGFDTGPIEMQFTLLESDRLSAIQFSELFSKESFRPFNRGGKEEFTDFECVERWTTFPNLGEQRFKASYCVRAYLDFPELFDVLYIARGAPKSQLGVNLHYTLAGVGRDAANKFHQRFVEAPQWN
ncbi:MAG: serine protease [Pseudomonadota bacterium]